MKLNNTRIELQTKSTELTETQYILSNNEKNFTIVQDELVNKQNQLSMTQNNLSDTQSELKATQAEYIETKDLLNVTLNNLSDTINQLQEVKKEQQVMLTGYADLREQVSLKQGDGKDTQQFITPGDEKVSVKALEIAGTFSEDNHEMWNDYHRLYQWVVNNIKYSYDSYVPILPQIPSGTLTWSRDYWRTPAETLQDKTGDCEDMAVLLTSLLCNYNNEKYSVWAIEIHNEDSGHLAVAIPVKGDNLTILDPAGKYYTGYRTGWIQSQDINIAINDWVAYWIEEMPDAYINAVFSNNFHKTFDNTQEFIDWAKARYD